MVVVVSKIAHEITARKRTDHVLRQSEERFRLVANLAPVLISKERNDKHKARVHFTKHGLPPNITKDVALCLFRVTQEALSNIVKHTQAQSADVELPVNSKTVSLRITGAGRGFDPDVSNPAGGIGLVSMRERLRLEGEDSP
jgi:signal transduction histidine kinase